MLVIVSFTPVTSLFQPPRNMLCVRPLVQLTVCRRLDDLVRLCSSSFIILTTAFRLFLMIVVLALVLSP